MSKPKKPEPKPGARSDKPRPPKNKETEPAEKDGEPFDKVEEAEEEILPGERSACLLSGVRCPTLPGAALQMRKILAMEREMTAH